MKTALVALIFCLSLNLISSFEVLDSRPNQTSNIYHSASHFQGLQHHLNNSTIADRHNDVAFNGVNYLRGNPYQEQPHFHNNAIAHRQANNVSDTTNRLIQQNRSRFQESKYQSQRRLRNTTVVQRQMHPNNNEIVHPRFRLLSQTRKNSLTHVALSRSTVIASKIKNWLIPKNNIQANRPLQADEKANINTKNSSGLLQVLTTKLIGKSAQTRRPFSFIDYFYQQQIRAFFEHEHNEVNSHTRSNIKTGLRR